MEDDSKEENYNQHGLRVSKHIFVGNSRLVTAMSQKDDEGNTNSQRERRYYYHADHLGSAQLITDRKGNQYEHIEYTPYGELWVEEVSSDVESLPFRFTGKEFDEETGLYYYGARYLDPKYSRWMSGDTALGDYIPQAPVNDEAKKKNQNLPGMGGVFNVVNLHVYHYAGNNPVKYIDPDGRFSKGALSLIKKHKEKILSVAKQYDVDPVAIASIIFNEKYHGFFAKLKNDIAFKFFDDGSAENSPLTRSYGLAEMQIQLAGELLDINPNTPGGKTKIYNKLMDDNIAIELIAKNIKKNEEELEYKLIGHEAGFVHNMGVNGYKKYLSGNKDAPSDRVAKRSVKFQKKIKEALGIFNTN